MPIAEGILWLFPCFVIAVAECNAIEYRSKLLLPEALSKATNILPSTASFCADLFSLYIMAVIEKTVMPEDRIDRVIFRHVICVSIILIFWLLCAGAI